MSSLRSIETQGFDVIGDVHGYADKLVGLLETMGYRAHADSYRHSSRTAVFIGDLIDRKVKIGDSDQRDVVRIVRSMVESGAARIVMGNHEFNAISWSTQFPGKPKRYLRTHRGKRGIKNKNQHHHFLDEVKEGSDEHLEIVAWFRTIPLWIDLGHVRFVHACWFEESMKVLRPHLTSDLCLTDEALVRGNRKCDDVHDAIENLLKGPEAKLDRQYHYLDKDGFKRKKGRVRWWDADAVTLRAAIDVGDHMKTRGGGPHPGLPDTPTNIAERFRYRDDVPVFFGHYWRTGAASVAGRSTVCVDYSAGRGGPLVAYRWSGGALSNSDFVSYGH